MTNYKQIMMDVIQGKAAPFLPFAPRLEIWYRCNKLRGTLPDEYKNASLYDIIDDLDIGHNYMIPDYLQFGEEKNRIHRSIGILYSKVANVLNTHFENVDIEEEARGDTFTIRYKTPYGTLQTVYIYNDTLKRSGVTIPSTIEKLIKSADDFKAVAYLFENAVLTPEYDMFEEYLKDVGNRTIANVMASNRVCGMHYILMELMEFEQFTYDSIDYPDEMAELAAVLDRFIQKRIEICLNSSADVITVGAHFDSTLTYRPFFEKYMSPPLKQYAVDIHSKNKYMACHTDSDNDNLMDLYVDFKMDIADSICTVPITQQNYHDIRNAVGSNITLLGLIPSVATLHNSFSDYEFDQFLNTLLQEISDDGARNIILAIADTTPSDADINRIRKIAKLSRQVKPR